jgi:hypothetical protein
VFIRAGRGDAGWTTENRRAKNVRVIDCFFTNNKYNAIEMFSVEDLLVLGNTVNGGVDSQTIEARPIRVVQSKNFVVANNIITDNGAGVYINTDSGTPNENGVVIGNNIKDTYGFGAIQTDFASYNLLIANNVIEYVNSTYSGACIRIFNRAGDEGKNVFISNNHIKANQNLDCIRIDDGVSGKVNGNYLLHTGSALTTAHYGVRLVACDGVFDVSNNTFEMDDNNARGLWDISGKATLSLNAHDNFFAMDIASSATNNAIAQSASSGSVRQWSNRVNNSASQTIATDAGVTLTPRVSPEVTFHTGTLTADRAYVLSTTNAFDGDRFRIARTGAGAFNLTNALKNLATDEWAEFQFDGSAWGLIGYGSL